MATERQRSRQDGLASSHESVPDPARATDHGGAQIPVVFVISQTRYGANGGAESISQILLHLRRVRPVVVTNAWTPRSRAWREAGIEVHVWNLAPLVVRVEERGSRLSRAARIVWANAKLARLVRRTGARIVHCNDPLAFFHAVFGSKLAGVRVLHNVRDIHAAEDRYTMRWRFASTAADHTLVLSEEMKRAYQERLATPLLRMAPISVIHSAVHETMRPQPPDVRSSIRARLGVAPNEFAIAYVANVNSKKAQLRLIEELGPELRRSIPNARVRFVGDFDPGVDPYARKCAEATKRLALESLFQFVGYTSDAASWYQAADVVLLASRREGLARCMIEGMACGVPVVSFDVCSAREMLEGHRCGLVVARDDYKALAVVLEELASSPQLRTELGTRGALEAKRLFDIEQVVTRYEELCRSLSKR